MPEKEEYVEPEVVLIEDFDVEHKQCPYEFIIEEPLPK